MSGIFDPFSSSAQIGWAPFKTSFPMTNEFLPMWMFPSESFLIRFPPDTEIPDWFIVVGLVVDPISRIFLVESPILAVVVEPDVVTALKLLLLKRHSYYIFLTAVNLSYLFGALTAQGGHTSTITYGSE